MLIVLSVAYHFAMLKQFITDWVKVGQSGPTIDGRTIEASWLEDAADTYSLETYTAVMWVDHFRFLGSMGKVVELKTKKDGDTVSLYARLQPNEFLLEYNKNGQKLFTSMELAPNFADTGQCYLVGLAVTDQPASLGTHELMFSARKQSPDNFIACGVELDSLDAPAPDDQPPSWFTRAMERFGFNIPRNAPGEQGANTNEDSMDAKQFKQLTDMLDAQDQRFKELEVKLEALTKGPAPAPADDQLPADADTDYATQPKGSDNLQSLKEQIAEMNSAFQQRFSDLTKRFEQAANGTAAPETEKPADGAGLV